MRAVIIKGPGGPEVLQVGEAERPEPRPDDLLVRVRATALNRADTLQRRGRYPVPPGESEVLGLELAGDVVGWGANVTGFGEGERVFGLVGGGGYAEYARLDKDMALRIPEGWSYAQAAAVPEVFLTAQETVFELGRLQGHEAVLIHAGGSGVGTAAIQMARHIGAQVYFTAGSQEKIDRAMALGATAGINYKTHDFAEEIMRLTDGAGVDVVEDFLAASYLERNLDVLKTCGRLVLVATMGGTKAEIDLGKVQRKRLQILGSVLRPRPLAEKREAADRLRRTWLPLLARGDIHPIIDSEIPLDRVQEAHARMESNQNFGKIILTVD